MKIISKLAVLTSLLLGIVAIVKPVPGRFLDVHREDIPGARELEDKVYFVAVCGMELKSALQLPRFFAYAVPALLSAYLARGHAGRPRYLPFAGDLKQHRTLSIWDSKEDMDAWVNKGAHARAANMIPKIAVYAKSATYNTTEIPRWREALEIWNEEGVVVFGEPREGDRSGRHF